MQLWRVQWSRRVSSLLPMVHCHSGMRLQSRFWEPLGCLSEAASSTRERIMEISDLGVVIAERVFECVLSGGDERPASLRIGAPVEDPQAGGDWMCPGQILGLGDGKIRAAYGVDAIQALQLCLQMLDALARQFAGAEKCRTTWLGMPDLGLLFPSKPGP